jgi:hypothetical protein
MPSGGVPQNTLPIQPHVSQFLLKPCPETWAQPQNKPMSSNKHLKRTENNVPKLSPAPRAAVITVSGCSLASLAPSLAILQEMSRRVSEQEAAKKAADSQAPAQPAANPMKHPGWKQSSAPLYQEPAKRLPKLDLIKQAERESFKRQRKFERANHREELEARIAAAEHAALVLEQEADQISQTARGIAQNASQALSLVRELRTSGVKAHTAQIRRAALSDRDASLSLEAQAIPLRDAASSAFLETKALKRQRDLEKAEALLKIADSIEAQAKAHPDCARARDLLWLASFTGAPRSNYFTDGALSEHPEAEKFVRDFKAKFEKSKAFLEKCEYARNSVLQDWQKAHAELDSLGMKTSQPRARQDVEYRAAMLDARLLTAARELENARKTCLEAGENAGLERIVASAGKKAANLINSIPAMKAAKAKREQSEELFAKHNQNPDKN